VQSGERVWSLGYTIEGLKFRIYSLGFTVEGLELRV
jgi:hypothetical protein